MKDAGIDALMKRVRIRLMRQIAAESTGHHIFVEPASGSWEPFLPGIDRKVLHQEGDVMSYLLKFGPGAVLPAHRHPVDEECLVLEGSVRIGPLVLPPGSFHKVRRNMLDADTSSDDGAVIYLRGAPPRLEDVI